MIRIGVRAGLCALCFAALGVSVALSHGLGGGGDVVVGEYLLEYGYDSPVLAVQEPTRLTFNLARKDDLQPVSFSTAWVRIVRPEEGGRREDVLFAGGLTEEVPGQAGMTYWFTREGPAVLSVRFLNEEGTIAETDFDVELQPALSSRGGGISPVLILGIVGVLLLLSAGGIIWVRHKKV